MVDTATAEVNDLDRQVGQQYAILQHAGFHSTVHCQVAGERFPVSRKTLRGQSAILQWAKEFNAKGNLYIGRNPRTPDDKVAAITSLTIDIDPDRPPKTAATDEQVQYAVALGRRVLAKYGPGSLLFTGNGVQILYGWPAQRGLSIEKFRAQCGAFTEKLRAEFACPGMTIDAIHDPERLIKLAGSVSTKGERSQWRVSRLLSVSQVPSTAVLKQILAIPVSDRTSSGAVDIRDVAHLQERVARATALLSRLAVRRRETYHEWVQVGMSLVELGPVGLQLWDTWSQGSDKYKEGACEQKWKTFVVGTGVTLGSLSHWAENDSPRPAAAVHERAAQPANRQQEPDGQQAVRVFTPAAALEELVAHDERLNAVRRAGGPEIPFGLRALDELFFGLHRQNIITVGARPGVGKTCLALTTVVANLRRGRRVLYLPTEMSVSEVLPRVAGIMGGYTPFSINREPMSSWQGYDAFKQEFGAFNLTMCDDLSPSVQQIEELVVQSRPDLLVLDHIQQSPGPNDQRNAVLTEVTNFLKYAARKYNMAVLVVSQVKRLKDEARPTMSDLRDCGNIEAISQGVVLLQRLVNDKHIDDIPVVAHVDKNRFGRSGLSVELLFRSAITKFEDAPAEPSTEVPL